MLSLPQKAAPFFPLVSNNPSQRPYVPKQKGYMHAAFSLVAPVCVAYQRASHRKWGPPSTSRQAILGKDGGRFRVLLIIHGYPPLYNAGSEVYTQTLARALKARGHEVLVFCREEDTIAPYFRIREQSDGPVKLKIINLPNFRDRYNISEVDEAVQEVIQEFHPDVVHCGHLNHLSMSLVEKVTRHNTPFIYTLHDFWMNCPRGQFIQFTGEDDEDLWPLCDGQEDSKCSKKCYVPRMGDPNSKQDQKYWTQWIGRRMATMRSIAEKIDLFISPAEHLKQHFIDDGFAPESKVVYCDYGFDRDRCHGRMRRWEATQNEPFTFAYIGTHKESKGVQHLIEAFAEVSQDKNMPPTRLKIFGRTLGQSTAALRRLADKLLPNSKSLEWCGEYSNEEIVESVFNQIDAIVVPSIWLENSPLVIHEALEAGVLVITADAGGMKEYVHHEVNGLLFKHRSASALAEQMRRCLRDPEWADKLAKRGYLLSEDGQIPSIDQHVQKIEKLYRQVIERRKTSDVTGCRGPGGRGAAELPWRVTFDTNPDDCNLHCDMCEGFSQYSTVQKERKEEGLKPRRMSIWLVEKVLTEWVDLHLESLSPESPKMEVIPSTMGEPLLYEHFEEFLCLVIREDARLQAHGAPGLKLNLTTNGTFPRLGAKAWAKKLIPVTSDIKISWNGAEKETQERIMRGQRFEEVLENVKELVAERDRVAAAGENFCRLTFQLTFLEENYQEIPDIIELAANLGINRVKGHHLWAHWSEMAGRAMKRNVQAVEAWNQMVPKALKVAECHGIKLEGIDFIPESAGEDLAPGAPCPFLVKEFWVAADGRFNPCCAPNEQRLSLGYFGNLNEDKLEDILRGEPYEDLVATYSTRSLCVGCNMRRWPKE